MSDVGITENLEIREIPVEVEKIIIKEVPVEVIVEKEIIKEVEKIVEVPVDRIIEIPVDELTKEEIIIGNRIHEDVPVRKKRKAKLQNNYQNLQFILTNENIGYSKSNNLALKIVKTKYALVLNPDTILKKNICLL